MGLRVEQLGGPMVLHAPAFAPGTCAAVGALAGHKEAIGSIVPTPGPSGCRRPDRQNISSANYYLYASYLYLIEAATTFHQQL